MSLVAVTFSGTIGVGTVITIATVVLGLAWGWLKIKQADPSEWRDNYLAEVTKREEIEKEVLRQRELKHTALNELAALKARTDLAPLMEAIVGLQKSQERAEERMTVRLEAFERNQKQTVEILSRLVETTAHAQAA